jgi:hypothetical protein
MLDKTATDYFGELPLLRRDGRFPFWSIPGWGFIIHV